MVVEEEVDGGKVEEEEGEEGEEEHDDDDERRKRRRYDVLAELLLDLEKLRVLVDPLHGQNDRLQRVHYKMAHER